MVYNICTRINYSQTMQICSVFFLVTQVNLLLRTKLFFCSGRLILCLNYRTGIEGQDSQTGTFTLKQIRAATDDFSPANKIGEGGFGLVYKVLE